MSRKEVRVNWLAINVPETSNVVACLYGFEAVCVDPDCQHCTRSQVSHDGEP